MLGRIGEWMHSSMSFLGVRIRWLRVHLDVHQVMRSLLGGHLTAEWMEKKLRMMWVCRAGCEV